MLTYWTGQSSSKESEQRSVQARTRPISPSLHSCLADGMLFDAQNDSAYNGPGPMSFESVRQSYSASFLDRRLRPAQTTSGASQLPGKRRWGVSAGTDSTSKLEEALAFRLGREERGSGTRHRGPTGIVRQRFDSRSFRTAAV